MINIPVLVTAPEGYAQRFVDALLSASDDTLTFQPLSVPMIQTASADGIAAFVAEMSRFDYVVFTSRKAITSLAEYLSTHPTSASLPLAAAIGNDNSALELLGVKPAFIACEPSLMGIAKDIPLDSKVAVLGPQLIDLVEPETVPNFLTVLKLRHMEVSFYNAYTTYPSPNEVLSQATAWLSEGGERWVAFTSATEAQVYRRICPEGATPHIVCFGPYTAHCISKEGIRTEFTSPDFSSFTAFAQNLRKELLSNSKL